MTAPPRRVALLTVVVGVCFGLFAYATGGSVCLAHRTECTPVDESVLRTLFLPLAVTVGYVLFRLSDASRFR